MAGSPVVAYPSFEGDSMPAEMLTKPALRPYLAATARFAAGDDNPREFLERSLKELERWEPTIGAFVNLNIPAARTAADQATARWRAGKPRSAIDGIPMGIKDVIETADMPTELGSPLFAGWRSFKDAASVVALRAAGAVIVGKTVTTEFAMSYPRGTRNPWNPAHTPGGSSSGSAAAVAAGIISAGLGTQVIGSTLRPASFCGVFGYKPSVHALNRTGSHDYQSQSCTGILAASLPDTWQVAYEIASRAGGDPGWPGLVGPDRAPPARKPRRLAFLETAGWAIASAATKQCMEDALARVRAAGVEVLTRTTHAMVDAIEPDIAGALELSTRINDFEMRGFIQSCVDRDIDKLSPVVRERLPKAAALTIADYRADLATRDEIRAAYAELAADCDACVTLGATGPAPEGLASTGITQNNVPASLLGIPALTLPVFMVGGLPLGLQVMGFADRDADAFGIAAWLLDLF
jgi:Asp-tRNA(Asn)/Glu-tRNA(Gln) amidotransferase A subunit family amidase